MGCAGSTEGESPNGRVRRDVSVKPAEDSDDDSKYRADQQASEASNSARGWRPSPRDDAAASHLSKEERAQVDTIVQRRRSLGRQCSLAADDSMRHYQLVTGNIGDDDDYYDASRIRVRAGRTMSWVANSSSTGAGGSAASGDDEGGPQLLTRRSSVRRTDSFSSGQGELRKSVSFTMIQSSTPSTPTRTRV